MKGKWQTGAVRHNNNTCHDGAVMGTITREYPRQPQQCDSFFRAEESIFVPSPSPLQQTSFFHQLNHFTPKPNTINASTSPNQIRPCLLLRRFHKTPTLHCHPSRGHELFRQNLRAAMSANSQTEKSEEAQHPPPPAPTSNNSYDLPILEGDSFTSQLSLNPLRFRAMIKQTNGS